MEPSFHKLRWRPEPGVTTLEYLGGKIDAYPIMTVAYVGSSWRANDRGTNREPLLYLFRADL